MPLGNAAKALEEKYPGSVVCDVPMSQHTSFRIGGSADAVFVARSAEMVRTAVTLCRGFDEKYMVTGNCSDLLVSDRGIRELVISVKDEMADVTVEGNRIVAECGARLARICETAAAHSLTGLEFAYGIPGCLGGALTMNAGAYGGQMKDVVSSIKIIEQNGDIAEIPARELAFGYRTSAISNGRIAVSAELQLKEGDEAAIRARMAELLQARRDKQPLEFPSAGSVFKRPEGHFAGALIQQAGLMGASIGGAEVSTKHAGFIINRGGATCEDVLSLVKLIQQRVFDMSGVMLEPEIRPVGEL